MPQASRSVALVSDGGVGLGRSLALTLAATGYAVVVTGADEQALGRVVGEITCGGGVARHVARKVAGTQHLQAAVEKAREAFGGLTHAIVFGTDRAEMIQDIEALRTAAGGPLKLLSVGPSTGVADELVLLAEGPADEERDLDLLLRLVALPVDVRSRRLLVG